MKKVERLPIKFKFVLMRLMTRLLEVVGRLRKMKY